MERLAQRIVAEGLSVRSVEEIVAIGGDTAEAVPACRHHGVRGPGTGTRSSTTSQPGSPTGTTPG